ncbi:MAG: hypothetical protein SXQ77_10765, partial [Halobacteria archaeon]|nr:hypothetical protein [Halobacteria archaeon]
MRWKVDILFGVAVALSILLLAMVATAPASAASGVDYDFADDCDDRLDINSSDDSDNSDDCDDDGDDEDNAGYKLGGHGNAWDDPLGRDYLSEEFVNEVAAEDELHDELGIGVGIQDGNHIAGFGDGGIGGEGLVDPGEMAKNRHGNDLVNMEGRDSLDDVVTNPDDMVDSVTRDDLGSSSGTGKAMQ